MKSIGIALGGLVLAASAALAQTTAPAEPPVVVMRGEGVVRQAPDQAFLRIGAESRLRDPKEAQAAAAEAMTAVQQKLAAAGVPRDAVRTVTVSLQQEFDYKDGRQTPRGYLARNVIEVRVDDLQRLGQVMDASVASGATSIEGLRFDLKQREAIEREALTRAVADAMARAEAAASGARRSLDRVLRVEETRMGEVRTQMMSAGPQMADAAIATPIAEGDLEIRARVTVTVSIK